MRLVKSHILPRALMMDQKREAKELWGLDSKQDGFVGLQSGYWKRFLCADHEGRFNEADRYAVDFCRRFATERRSVYRGTVFELDNPHPDRLADFVYSSIWRTMVAVKSPSLGPYLQRLTDHLFGDKPVDFPLLITRAGHVDNHGRDSNITVLSHEAKVDNLRFTRFMVAGLAWWVKVDNRPLGADLAFLDSRSRNPALILGREPMKLGEDPMLQGFIRDLGARRKSLF